MPEIYKIKRRLDPRSMVKIAIVILIFTIAGIYGYSQAYELLRGPVVTISSPENGFSINGVGLISVSGKALNASDIFLNGAPITMDPEGYFEENLLATGRHTIIEVSVSDRFGRRDSSKVSVVVNE